MRPPYPYLVLQRTMRSAVIVIKPPTINDPTGLRQAKEQFSIQQFVPETTVEALHVAVFPRAPLGNEQRLHGGPVEPLGHFLGHKLCSVVAP